MNQLLKKNWWINEVCEFSRKDELGRQAIQLFSFSFFSALPNELKEKKKEELTAICRMKGRLVCLFFSCFWLVMAAASGRGSAKRKKTKEKTNQADPPFLFSPFHSMKLMKLREKKKSMEFMKFVFLFLFFCGLWAGCPPMLRKREENEEKKQTNEWNWRKKR